MSNSLMASWKGWSAQYAARPKREKLILGVAALAVVWALLDALWLTPATREFKTQQTALDKKTKELAQLDAERTTLKQALVAREAEQKRELDAARAKLAAITGELAEFEKALVPARNMPDFLRGLLPGANVDVVSLRTIEPTPLIIRPVVKETRDAKDAKVQIEAPPAGNVAGPAANIYRHGIEITLAGNYDALLTYLARLEAAPQKVLWGRLELKAVKYPRNELTLVLYTLSLDPSWLVV